MLGQYADGHILKERVVRIFELKADLIVSVRRDFLYVLIVGENLRFVFRIHDRLDREFYVLCSERLAVMPLDIFTKFERIRICIFIQFVALRQRRNDLIVFVMSHQPVKEQQVDLPVLIDGRVDPSIISASVYQRVSVFLCFRRAAFFAAAARRKTNAQSHNEN